MTLATSSRLFGSSVMVLAIALSSQRIFDV